EIIYDCPAGTGSLFGFSLGYDELKGTDNHHDHSHQCGQTQHCFQYGYTYRTNAFSPVNDRYATPGTGFLLMFQILVPRRNAHKGSAAATSRAVYQVGPYLP